MGSTVVFAVVDVGGHSHLLHRLDKTLGARVGGCIEEVRTAASFR